MKLLLTILFFTAQPYNLFAQWFWQNPLPQGNRLYDICFVDSLYGWSVGIGSTVMSTTNGGQNWQNINNKLDELFLKTSFIDRNTGWILTYPSYSILKTTDGGLSWDSLSSQPIENCFDLSFINDSLGYIAGGLGGEGIVAFTSDGGSTWNQNVATNYFGYILSIHFLNPNVGWASGSIVVKTTNGGQNWIEMFPPCHPVYGCAILEKIHSISEQHTYVVGDINYQNSRLGYFANTSNGGNNWQYQIFGQPLTDVYFSSRDTGWVADNSGEIYFTTDRGNNWSQLEGRANLFSFINKNKAWGIVDISQIMKTNNGWQTSEAQTAAVTTDILMSVASIDSNYIVAVGENSVVVGTTNGGVEWNTYYNSNLNSTLNGVSCKNPLEIFCVGSNGDVLHSSDWGTSWTTTNLGDIWLNNIAFVSQDTGFITGTNFSDGLLYRTTNGGLTWNLFLTFTESYNVGAIKFSNEGLGWLIVGKEIFRTTDSGTNWNSVYSGPLSFFDLCTIENCAWFTWANQVTFTSDGGYSWATHEICQFIPYAPNDARSISFVDKFNGWAATHNGEIYKTTDGGIVWTLDSDLNYNSLFSICQANSVKLWAVGSGGTILYYNTSPNTVDPIQESISNFLLSQNYPNPFNPSTIISWQLPASSFVTLKVYDILGREVAALVNEEKPAGIYETEFNAANLPSGVYFYQLQAGNPSSSSGQVFVETKKMILIK